MARRGLGILWRRRCGLTRPGDAGDETEEANAAQTDLSARPFAVEEEDAPAAGEDHQEAVGPFGEGEAHRAEEADGGTLTWRG